MLSGQKNQQINYKGDNDLWGKMQDYPDTESLDGIDALEMAWRTINKGEVSFQWI